MFSWAGNIKPVICIRKVFVLFNSTIDSLNGQYECSIEIQNAIYTKLEGNKSF